LIPLHQEFGWSHETIGLAVSLNLLCFGLGAPFAAALIERFGRQARGRDGARRDRGLRVADGRDDADVATVPALGPRQRLRHGRGVRPARRDHRQPVVRPEARARDRPAASYASGQLVFLPGLAWLAGFDWRYAAVGVAAVALLVVLPAVVVLMRDRPEDIGLRPYGADESWQPPPRDGAGVRRGDRRARVRDSIARLLAPRRHVLRLRRDDQRPRVHPSDPGSSRRGAGLIRTQTGEYTTAFLAVGRLRSSLPSGCR
jgi:hypothetical protein